LIIKPNFLLLSFNKYLRKGLIYGFLYGAIVGTVIGPFGAVLGI